MASTLTAKIIEGICASTGVAQWGAASNDPLLPLAPNLPIAISLLMPFSAGTLDDVEKGPTITYYREYLRLNAALNQAATVLADELLASGHDAVAVPATIEADEADPDADWANMGVFPHKSAATQAGLGWIGKTALFVSPRFGSALRLATVFTDLMLPVHPAVRKGHCGRCRACVDACPVGAGKDVRWQAGMAREDLYDVLACENYLDNFPELGGVCGICIAVCPFSRRQASD